MATNLESLTMKIQISNKSPNNESSMSTFISAPRQGREAPVSHQPLDSEGTLTLSIEDETNLRFEICGDIEAVPNSLTNNGLSVQPTASAKDSGDGEGRIVVNKDGKTILVIAVTVGGDTMIGLVLDSLG